MMLQMKTTNGHSKGDKRRHGLRQGSSEKMMNENPTIQENTRESIQKPQTPKTYDVICGQPLSTYNCHAI